MSSNRPMAWRKTRVGAFARGTAALGLAAMLSSGPALADPIALVATQTPNPASYFSLDFGAYGGISSAQISQTDFALEIDTDLGTAQFTQYRQFVNPLLLFGVFSTGNIRVEVVPGSSTGTFDVLTGEFTTQELYDVYFDGDLRAFGLTSPVRLPSTSEGTMSLSALAGGEVVMAWTGTYQLPNPSVPGTFVSLRYTCSVQAAFAPEPLTLLELALIPNVLNLTIPLSLETNLLSYLNKALNFVNTGRELKAATTLVSFISVVQSQRGRSISVADADVLISDAQAAIVMLRNGVISR